MKQSKMSQWPETCALSDPRLRKWVIPTYMYEGTFFPKYLSGSGYLAKKEDARNGRRLFPFLDSTLQPKLTLLLSSSN